MRSFTDEINVTIQFRYGLRYDTMFENVILSDGAFSSNGFSETLYYLLKPLVFSYPSLFYTFPSSSLSWKGINTSKAGLYYDPQMYKFYKGMPSFSLRFDDRKKLVKRRLQPPSIFLKRQQWNGYGRTIHNLVHITTNGTAFFQSFDNNSMACFDFLHTQDPTYACTSEVMYVLHLSRVHYFTLEISARMRGMNLSKYWESISKQEYFLIRAVEQKESVLVKADSKRSRTFASSHYMYAVQCRLESSNKPVSYEFWINGFTEEDWIVALSFTLIGSLLLGQNHRSLLIKQDWRRQRSDQYLH